VRRRHWRVALAASGLALLLSCGTSPVQVRSGPAKPDRPIYRLAIVPFEPRIDPAAEARLKEAANFATSRALRALSGQPDLMVIGPLEVLQALEGVQPAPQASDHRAVGPVLASAFGVDALVFGRVRRSIERTGGPKGATRPAAVGLSIELRSVAGALLWRGSYDERQQSLSDNPGGFSKARARGFRWLTAEELAEFGVEELVGEMSSAIREWR
jgi:hypothetical protein